MATLQKRPFSRNYSGLVTQSVVAGCIITIAITAHEIMKRRRRGKRRENGLGSVETWEFGYLYQGRSWAKNPSPPHPRGWPLLWVKQAITFPETKLCELRGVDATLYCRFIRGCFWFTVLHTFTTSVILLPIHIKFSGGAAQQVSTKSMDRALISSLVQTQEGLRLLWIHLVLMVWVSVTWIFTLTWIAKGAFQYRAQCIKGSGERARQETENGRINPHPHPQHPFHEMYPTEKDEANKGLRLRTVMVTNIPNRLRSEKELKEYFEYHMSRPLAKPAIGLTSARQPGLINKMSVYLINRIRKFEYFSHSNETSEQLGDGDSSRSIYGQAQRGSKPEIERVILARKMTELASLLDRREEMLKRLEAAHIKLAKKTLTAVKEEMDRRRRGPSRTSRAVKELERVTSIRTKRSDGKKSTEIDVERATVASDDEIVPEDRMELLIRTLGPFVDEFEMRKDRSRLSALLIKLHLGSPVEGTAQAPRSLEKQAMSPETKLSEDDDPSMPSIWEALFSLPRSTLDPYQPLVHLSALFRGKTVPSIDYYTVKVGFLTSLITESRSRAITDFEPVSTAFVTFANPDDARRACKYLAVHPDNPLACSVEMAPEYEDLDWVRLMKQTFKAELLRDWVVDIGVWAFIIAWIIPVSSFVALVNINNIATVIPGLQTFLSRHYVVQELITSLLPTVLTSLLMLLVPLILLLIAKKAHTIITLSALHDRIMIRYHKFLVANVLVFFCVGVAALESFFTSFKSSSLNVLQEVGSSFPAAGPFYVGWIIFIIGLHGGIELCLFGLPLFMYPSTRRAVTPRKRAIGLRPRTFNYYYWLPNHTLIVFVVLVFSILNPLLMPFAMVYFSVESVVIKNQLLHVYAKNYEGNGNLLLIRMVRYTLDGLILAQVIFLGFLAVVKKEIHVGLTAVMIACTITVKIVFTRICRAKFEAADTIEAHVVCGQNVVSPPVSNQREIKERPVSEKGSPVAAEGSGAKFKTWKLPKGFKFSYSAVPQRTTSPDDHKPIPFEGVAEFKRMKSFNAVSTDPYGPTTVARAQAGSVPEFRNGQTTVEEFSPQRLISESNRPPLVTPHSKYPAWDDASRLDRPYDNPYYSRPVHNHLWLPRDPIGILDLDDTVNVFRALTSDSSLGQLGEWIEGGIALTELPSAIYSDDSISERPSIRRQLSGEEDIALPQEIAERVDNLQKENDVEYGEDGRPPLMHRPSILSRQASSLNSRRRSSTPLPQPATSSNGAGPSRMRSSSFMTMRSSARQPSLFSHMEPQRRRGSYFDPASQPDLHAQAPFARSRFSVASPGAMVVASPGPSRISEKTDTAPITTREAVVGEVIAEEYNATENRLREEEAETKQKEPPETRSWLTSWMFSRKPWAS